MQLYFTPLIDPDPPPITTSFAGARAESLRPIDAFELFSVSSYRVF